MSVLIVRVRVWDRPSVFRLFQLVWMGTCMSLVGCLPEGWLKQRLHYSVYTTSFQILGESISAVVTYHNQENKATSGGICVANHTSPIDVLILACDNAYALVSVQGERISISLKADR